MAGAVRSFVAANHWLSLDGLDCGMIEEVSGGNIKGNVVEYAQNGAYWRKKHLGTIAYEPFKLKLGCSAGSPLNDRVKSLLAANHQYFNGAVNACDFNLKTKSIKEFTNALLTEVTLPACDGAGKDPAYMSVTIEAERIRAKAGDDSTPNGALNAKQKFFTPANFRLTIDKVGKEATKRVAKCADGFTVKLPTTRDDIGDAREMELCPSKGCDYPNLSFEVSNIDIDAFLKWHEDFVIRGNCGEDQETSAELLYLSQDFSKEICRVTMYNVGIFNITANPIKDHQDGIWRSKVECYMERCDIEFLG